MFEPLPQSFFQSSADQVAPLLLGQWLIRNTPEGPCGGLIVETEAYLADDPACHAYGGKTNRNRVMWGPPGRAYVYLIYGYHFCVNAVCQPEGIGEAVLIRALDPKLGESIMRKNRPVPRDLDLTNGPAKLCAALAIDRGLDGINLCSPDSPFFIARNREPKNCGNSIQPIVATRRIGISKAADLLLRFHLEGNRFVSKRK